MADELKIDRHGRVTVLTLNRPERRNALNLSLAAAVEEAVAEFGRDNEGYFVQIPGLAGENAARVLMSNLRDVKGVRSPLVTPMPKH